MRKGTQIAYIPLHANGNINHPDVEFGFVTSIHRDVDSHYCRYWRKGHLGELRTTSCSELTPNEYLVIHVSVEPFVVNRALKQIMKGE